MKRKRNEAIKTIRAALGMSQSAFGTMLGVSRDAVAQWEGGLFRISERNARLIHWNTGADINDILYGRKAVKGAVRGEKYTRSVREKYLSQWSGPRPISVCMGQDIKLVLCAALKRKGPSYVAQIYYNFVNWMHPYETEFGIK